MNLTQPLYSGKRISIDDFDSLILEEFLEAQEDVYDIDPRDIPVQLAASPDWASIDPDYRNRILGGFLRHVAKTAVEQVPLYHNDPRWKDLRSQIDHIDSIDNLIDLPVMAKDEIQGTGSPEIPGIKGFRRRVRNNSKLLVPRNFVQLVKQQEKANPDYKKIMCAYYGKSLSFGSGGTEGDSTKTHFSALTIESEAWALARALEMNGFKRGQPIACMYSPDHKGGKQLARAAEIMEMPFFPKAEIFSWVRDQGQEYETAISEFKTALFREDYDATELHAELIRKGIREFIREYEIEIIEAVQPMDTSGPGAKGMGLAFMNIYEEDPLAFKTVKNAFLTGFTVPEFAYRRLQEDGITVSTTWGSTEAMALATSGYNTHGNVNDLEALHFPTTAKIAWYKERDSKPRLEEVPPGYLGAMFVTGLIGVGSVYINYLMDLATRTDRGYKDIHRINRGSIIGGNSCAADALTPTLSSK